MRVLAIRGRNLASLAGDFEVDFTAEPLADAGIFAITGPTGAGKSTLLDAMCLALFDTVPRLGAAPSRGRIETAGDELSPTDPRALLRHGTGEGSAEIDFVGRDGEAYRARWSVQRARRKPTGALQKTEHSVVRLKDGANLTGRKKETLAEIQALVGLSADQFRRAVLLAQGDFEAFIRADDNERALLLERLTGSHIYADLGRAAYDKAAMLRQRQDALRDRIDAQDGLDDQRRAVAEAARDTAQAEVEAAAATLAALEAAARWEADRAALADKLLECDAAVERARVEQEAAAPRVEGLRRRKLAFLFAGDWQAREDARDQAVRAQDEAVQRIAARDHAATAAAGLQAEQRLAADTLAADQAALAGLEPSIAAARALDLQLGEAEAGLARLAEAHAARAAALQQAREREARSRKLLADAQAVRDRHDAWLREHGALAPLVAREGELDADLAEHTEFARRFAMLTDEQAAADVEKGSADAARTATEEAARAAAQAHEATEAALAAAQAAAPAPAEQAELTRRRDRLIAIDPMLLDWRNKSARAVEAAAALRSLNAQLVAARAERDELTGERATVAATLPAHRLRLDEARRAGALADAASGQAAARLRAELVAGEPCPVCGATEHALTAVEALIGAQREAQQQRIAVLDAELTRESRRDAALASRIEALASRIAADVEEQARLTGQRDRADAALTEAADRLASAAAAAGLDAAAEGFPAALANAQAHADALRSVADTAAAALADARSAEQAARTQRDRARATHDAAVERQRSVAAQAAERTASLAYVRDTLDRLTRSLDSGFGAAAAWRSLPDARRWLATQAAAWRTRSAEQADALAAIPALELHLTDARAATAAAAAAAEAVDAQVATLKSARDAHAAQRNALLDGEAVTAVEARGAAMLASRRQALELAQHRLAEAREAQSAAIAHAQAAEQAALQAAEDHARRDRDFTARIAAAALDEAAVVAAAADGAEALAGEEQALATLERAVGDALAQQAQRRDDLARHDASGAPELTGDALTETLAEARAAADAANAALADALFLLRRDDAVRAATAALRAQLEQERADARVWLQLNELIGDAKGARFRNFAQGLTLDRLLAYANARLAELKPRYALNRGRGGDMLIQVVDHDMAGEVRGVHNLSGGERFLISLALALGLAEMSTGRGLRIESLFIDEGFGALDTASLGQAIAVLEQLHAGGRRVGVISHVEEVKERIPVKIEVTPLSRGTSTLSVTAG
ncbi:AAA family ATPase [Sphingomonas jatrophae]|uniref:Exonuclease SbcC n=1 Tax=Sphingomonas jatrophae TaxID=1166337 RepID=A0A1I6M370_9SPHN|nr:AAA family ATPase [Sphingomonas jatrophae]SFS09992.1 exonuclease SbcC [Sphingomonas jatrophae]